MNRFGKTAVLTAAAAVTLVALGGAAGAAAAPVSDPHIVARFDLAAGQTPRTSRWRRAGQWMSRSPTPTRWPG